MFASQSKPHLWMEIEVKTSIYVYQSALQNGHLSYWRFEFLPQNFKNIDLKMPINPKFQKKNQKQEEM